MQHQYRQEKRLQVNDKPVIKDDNKIYRVQNPVRSEFTLSILFLLKGHISRSVKKTAEAHPQINIIYDKVGGSWWKPEYHIIVGGKTKKAVQTAADMLEKTINRKNG